MYKNGATACIHAAFSQLLQSYLHSAMIFSWALLFISLVASCGNEQNVSSTTEHETIGDFSFESKIKYAKHFSIRNHGTWKQLTVTDPWQGGVLGNYVLVPRSSQLPDSLPPDAVVVRVPVRSVACLSSTHIGVLALLGLRDKIAGVASGDQIWDSVVGKRFASGSIIEVGRKMNTNIEQLIALSPEMVMKSGFDNVRSEDTRIAEAHIPIAYYLEWMEPTLLARAEWMKFTAAFFCQERLADSLFDGIESRYTDAIRLASSVADRPSVLVGVEYKSTWHIAGERSYVAQMLGDAGAAFIPNGEKGDSPMSFEQVLQLHANDDIWLNWMHQGINSIETLGRMNERYELFKAYRTGEVYNHDKRLNPAGGNDFWESGVSHPDLLLKDLIKIFHPELLPDYEMVYWRKLPQK